MAKQNKRKPEWYERLAIYVTITIVILWLILYLPNLLSKRLHHIEVRWNSERIQQVSYCLAKSEQDAIKKKQSAVVNDYDQLRSIQNGQSFSTVQLPNLFGTRLHRPYVVLEMEGIDNSHRRVIVKLSKQILKDGLINIDNTIQ